MENNAQGQELRGESDGKDHQNGSRSGSGTSEMGRDEVRETEGLQWRLEHVT